jgi:hypothetical protein
LEYRELREESGGVLACIGAISKKMAVTVVAVCSTMDIFTPESKRTVANLSAIIDFPNLDDYHTLLPE